MKVLTKALLTFLALALSCSLFVGCKATKALTPEQLTAESHLLAGDLRGVAPIVEDEETRVLLLKVADALDAFEGAFESVGAPLAAARRLAEKNLKGDRRSHVLAVLFLVDSTLRRWEAYQ